MLLVGVFEFWGVDDAVVRSKKGEGEGYACGYADRGTQGSPY